MTNNSVNKVNEYKRQSNISSYVLKENNVSKQKYKHVFHSKLLSKESKEVTQNSMRRASAKIYDHPCDKLGTKSLQ